MARDEGEQPDDALAARLVREHGAEMGEVELSLATGGVSNRTSNGVAVAGRSSRKASLTAV